VISSEARPRLNFSLGTDIVYIPRIQQTLERFGDRFLNRVYTATEQQEYVHAQQSASRRDPAIAYLAGRWAAKEAVVKALGTGWRGIAYREVEIYRQGSGAPQVKLYGAALTEATAHGLPQWQLSLSHDTDYAIATALLILTPDFYSRP
jgi:holo-[acyl-carrier protein] synthase